MLRKAVAGLGNRIRVFHEWRDDHKAAYSEPPAAEMRGWRQRVADCFGFDFTKASTRLCGLLWGLLWGCCGTAGPRRPLERDACRGCLWGGVSGRAACRQKDDRLPEAAKLQGCAACTKPDSLRLGCASTAQQRAEGSAWAHALAIPACSVRCLQAVAPTDPLRVLFINRHYREGRHIVNHADLAHQIE